jgi:hypothetical protein
LDLGRFFSFFIFTQTVAPFGWGISPWQGLYLPTGQHKQNKRAQTSMPQVGFEPKIAVFEQATTVHDRSATTIGNLEQVMS